MIPKHPTTQAHTTKAAAEVRELITSLHKLESALVADNLDLTALLAAKDDVKAKHSGLALSLRQTYDSACRSLKLHLEALPMSDLITELFEDQVDAQTDVLAQIQILLSFLGKRVASPLKFSFSGDLIARQPLILRAKYRQLVSETLVSATPKTLNS